VRLSIVIFTSEAWRFQQYSPTLNQKCNYSLCDQSDDHAL